MTWWTRFAVVAVCGCLGVQFAAAQAAVSVPPFDGRAWQVGFQGGNKNESVVEYVLPGESVNAWKELLTHQTLAARDPKLSLDALIEQTKAGLAQGCPSLHWHMLAQAEREALYQWSDEGCGGDPPQYEIVKLRRTEGSVCRWAYASKVMPVAASTQEALGPLLDKLACD